MSIHSSADRLNRLIQDLSTETILLHETVADRLGLNTTDHKALGFLVEAGTHLTAGQLATEMELTTGAITGIVDRLEQGGFVRRRRASDDRRQVILEVNMDKVRRDVFPIFEKLRRQMSALAELYSQRDLGTIAAFVEQGVAISRAYRATLQPKGKAAR
jgi:DNA-binding MarR family transcriptional regulator